MAVLISLGALSSCGDVCEDIEGKVFRSVDEHECGLGQDGLIYCTWSIAFEGGEFDWQHSDFGTSGSYSCDGMNITGEDSGSDYSGSYDPDTQRLSWEGIEYE